MGLLSLGAALLLTACRIGPPSDAGGDRDPGPRSNSVVVGAFDFPESAILAEIYDLVLENAGIEATVIGEVGAREVMLPALEQGQIDIVPEYLGAALSFLVPEADPSTLRSAHAQLKAALGHRGIDPLAPAPGQNRNAFVVTMETAQEHSLHRISDLAPVASRLILGGPPECHSRPLCLQGLEDVYGLRFDGFQPLDAGGPATLAALRGGEIDVALLFTTDPALDSLDLVVLRDDKGLQPQENVVPVVRHAVLQEQGDVFLAAIDALSIHITTRALRDLNRSAAEGEHSAREIARSWLESEGLI